MCVCMEEPFVSVGGRDNVWTEIFGRGSSKTENWPGLGSKRLASPRRSDAGVPHLDELGRGSLGSLGGEERSCPERAQHSDHESMRLATFSLSGRSSPRRLRGSIDSAMAHQADNT